MRKLYTILLSIPLLLCHFAMAQSTLSGRITDEENDPLISANVIIKGTAQGVLTDLEGKYSLQVSPSDTIIVSYIGYQTQEVPVNGQSTIDVTLSASLSSLEEVVVTGYGTQRRGDVTAAISSVQVEDIQSIALTSVDQAIQGRVAGVSVTQAGGGDVGGGFQVNIRGIGTINSESPLYVIDGIPIQESGSSQLGGTFLNSLNPNDIESIDILKDASAAAIYGARASGGVVIITTKRGKAGPVRVDFNGYYGIATQNRRYDLLNADQYVAYIRELHSNSENTGSVLPTAFDGTQPPFDTDWQDALFENAPAPIQNYNVGLSGGNQNATFSIGLEYFDQEGTIVGNEFERYSIRANSDFKIGNRIKVGESVLLSRTTRSQANNVGGRRAIEHAIKQGPTVPVRDESFLGGFGFPDTDEGQDASNPVADQLLNQNEFEAFQIWASLNFEAEIITGLKYQARLGIDFSYGDFFGFNEAFEGVRRLRTASGINLSRSENFNPLAEQFLTYDNTFGKHTVSSLFGFSVQDFQFTGLQGTGQELPPGVQDVDAAASNIIASSSNVQTSLRSIFGRITYDFDEKYLFTFNVRRDESSRLFRGSNPSQVFPSFSAGWRLSRENFLADNGFISQLKLRGGWGRLGNQSVLSAYPTDALLVADFFYPIGGGVTQGISQAEQANPDITWEVTEQWDIGLDLGLLNNRILFNFDYFNRETEDLIIRASTPPSTGLAPPFVNIGSVRNTGFEFVATYRKLTGEFQFDVSANATIIDNEVLSLDTEEAQIFSGNATDDISNVSLTSPGQPIGSFFGFVTDGIFQDWDDVYSWPLINQALDPDGNFQTDARDAATAGTNTAPGDIRFVDTNGDGVVNADDRQILGSPIPDVTFGFTGNASYKGIDVQVFLQGAVGQQVFNAATRWLEDLTQNFNQGSVVLDRWTPTNPSNTIPRAAFGDPNGNIRRVSDRFVEDASWVKFRNFTIGYTLQNSISDVIKAQKIRIYGTIQNLAVWTDYSGLEPEIGSLSNGNATDVGIDRMVYPQPRTFIIGLQLGF